MVNLDDLLLRLGEEVITEIFLSEISLETLRSFDPSLIKPSSLIELITKKIPKYEFLRNKKMRNSLIGAMRKEEIDELAQFIGLKEDNIYHALENKQIKKNSESEKQIFNFFNIDIPIESHEYMKYVDDPTYVTPSYTLFEHQHKLLKEIEQELVTKPYRVLLHMPTGSGKTRTAIRALSAQLLGKKPFLVIWLAHSEELCNQALDEFENAWKSIGDRKIRIFRFFGSSKTRIIDSIDEMNDGFMVIGLQRLYSEARNNDIILSKLADKVKIVIMDEAHKAVAETYKYILEQLTEKHNDVKLLGLSATPGRSTSDGETDKNLVRFFKNKKITFNSISNDPIRFLVDNKYISQTTFERLSYSDKPLTYIEQRLLDKKPDVPEEIRIKIAKNLELNRHIIKTAEDLILEGHKRIIIFAATVEHARDISIILSAKTKIQSYSLTSNTPYELRKKIILEYKNDENVPKIICNYNILTAGFDAPQTSAVIIARATKSLVLYSQMVGRAIRGEKAGGTAKAKIVTIADPHIGAFWNITDAFLNWEERWRE